MKAQAWLWPDQIIGKRASRQLREEHNALVNLNAELIETLRDLTGQVVETCAARKFGDGPLSMANEKAHAAIAHATKP